MELPDSVLEYYDRFQREQSSSNDSRSRLLPNFLFAAPTGQPVEINTELDAPTHTSRRDSMEAYHGGDEGYRLFLASKYQEIDELCVCASPTAAAAAAAATGRAANSNNFAFYNPKHVVDTAPTGPLPSNTQQAPQYIMTNLEYLQAENFLLQVKLDESERNRRQERQRLQEQHFQALCQIKQWYQDELERLGASDKRKATAAVVIQMVWRGCPRRRAFGVIKLRVVQFQALLRCHLARQKYLRHKKCVIMIQAATRMYLACREYKRALESYRARILMQSLAMVGSAMVIQTLYRQRHAFQGYCKIRNSVILVQSVVRRCVVRRRASSRLHLKLTMVTIIQATWRRFSKRQGYLKAHAAVLRIQSVLRAWKVRAEYLRLKASLAPPTDTKGQTASSVSLSSPKQRSRKPLGLVPLGQTKATAVKAGTKARMNHSLIERSRANVFGDAAGGHPIELPTPAALPVAGRNLENIGSNAENFQNTRPSQTKVSQKRTIAVHVDAATVEKLRVVDLREMLLADGVEKKVLRNIRKSGLVEMVIARGCYTSK